MWLFFVVSFYSKAHVLKISQNLVNTEQDNKLFFIVLKIYAAIFCRIILFEDRCFEDFAKFCEYWTVYSVKFQAPEMELTNHSLEVELTQNRPQSVWFPGYIPEIL